MPADWRNRKSIHYRITLPLSSSSSPSSSSSSSRGLSTPFAPILHTNAIQRYLQGDAASPIQLSNALLAFIRTCLIMCSAKQHSHRTLNNKNNNNIICNTIGGDVTTSGGGDSWFVGNSFSSSIGNARKQNAVFDSTFLRIITTFMFV